MRAACDAGMVLASSVAMVINAQASEKDTGSRGVTPTSRLVTVCLEPERRLAPEFRLVRPAAPLGVPRFVGL